MTEFIVGSKWPTLEEVKKAAEEYIISRSKSWKHYKADKRCWVRICKNRTKCEFRIRFNIASAGSVELIILTSHTCPRTIHSKCWLGYSISFLFSNQRSRGIVEEDRHVKPKQLMIEGRLNRSNKINYQQAHCLCERLRTEIFGDEILSFQKMPSLIKKMQSSMYPGFWVD